MVKKPHRQALLWIAVCFTAFLANTAAETTARDLQAKLANLHDEQARALEEAQSIETTLADRDAEITRLRATAEELKIRLDAHDGENDSTTTEFEISTARVEPPEVLQRHAELIVAAAGRVVLLQSGDKPLGTAFLGPHEGGVKILTAAELVSGQHDISILDQDGNLISTTDDVSCPAGVALVCLHPAGPDGLPHFELAASDDLPTVGDRVAVIALDLLTQEIRVAGGAIRGIGPDVWELDADLDAEMTGAPVLSLDSGKVIGIVAPQVDGVAMDWARGTRHEEARVFAARLDRMGASRTIPFARFTNEAEYIKRFEEENHIAWVTYMLLEYGKGGFPPHIFYIESLRRKARERERHVETMKFVREEAAKYPSNRHITSALRWVDGGLQDRSYLLRQIAGDLRIQRDLSADFTWYHGRHYQNAASTRRAGIQAMLDNANRVGR